MAKDELPSYPAFPAGSGPQPRGIGERQVWVGGAKPWSLGRQWEPSRGAGQRLCTETWKETLSLPHGPSGLLLGCLLAECGMFWGTGWGQLKEAPLLARAPAGGGSQ